MRRAETSAPLERSEPVGCRLHGSRGGALTSLVFWLLCLLARSAGAGELSARIDKLLLHPGLQKARIGVVVESLVTGDVLYERAPRLALIPASNTKLVTCAAALGFLGPEWLFVTRLSIRGNPTDSGVLEGDVIVEGGGDPCWQDRFCNGDARGVLVGFAKRIREAGVRRVTGDLIVDATCFDDVYVAPGWPPNQLGFGYCAPVAGLSMQNNCLRVVCDTSGRPGSRATVSLWPPVRRYAVVNELRLVAERRVNQVAVSRPDDTNRVRVRGRSSAGTGSHTFDVPVRCPPLFVGRAMMAALDEAGVDVSGKVRVSEAPIEGNLHEIARHESPLVDALRVMCKESDNGIAEHVFKSVGRRRYGQGRFETGARAVAHLFRSIGVDKSEASFDDGSGLSRTNRISAHAMVRLLAWVYEGPFRDSFVRSLAVAGVDGTLADRMTEDAIRLQVRAKSGYLRGVSALSGYAHSSDGETIAFSILFNGFSGSNRTMKGIQDDICRELVRLESRRVPAQAAGSEAGG